MAKWLLKIDELYTYHVVNGFYVGIFLLFFDSQPRESTQDWVVYWAFESMGFIDFCGLCVSGLVLSASRSLEVK